MEATFSSGSRKVSRKELHDDEIVDHVKHMSDERKRLAEQLDEVSDFEEQVNLWFLVCCRCCCCCCCCRRRRRCCCCCRCHCCRRCCCCRCRRCCRCCCCCCNSCYCCWLFFFVIDVFVLSFSLQKNADKHALKLAQEEFEHCLKQIRV